MKVYLPWLGEFGTELLKWVPRVYADEDEYIVCYEKGKEVLYPKGQPYVIDRVKEKDRKSNRCINMEEIYERIKTKLGKNDYITAQQSGLRHKPFEPQICDDYNIDCDVALFPRWRTNVQRKNWTHWIYLCQALQAEGVKVFACGHGDSSVHVPCEAAWDFEGHDLEASIYAIKNSKLRIGPMGALGVLSLYCGMKPWILLTEKGLPREGSNGCNWIYYHFADHKNVGWKVLPWLDEPERIIDEVKRELG